MIKADKNKIDQERSERLRLGYIAREGMGSEFWLVIVKPIMDSMLKGILDITSVDITSEKKASIELAGRKMAAKYIQELETLINGYVIDAESVRKIENKEKNTKPLYKEV